MSDKVEIIEKKDPIVQLEASKSSIKDLLNDLLNETKGFKYQITVKVLFKKYKLNGEIVLKKFYTWLMFGLILDLVGMLNQLSFNILIFQLIYL